MTAEDERTRRDAIWARLLELAPARIATTEMLGEAGIRPKQTGQGIFRDLDATKSLAPEGVTLTLLDVGAEYPDAFDADAGEYHYPSTDRGTRDANEIAATKNASTLGLPIFVVLEGPSAEEREVRRGWVERWDDARRVFLVSFASSPDAPTVPTEEAPFLLRGRKRSRRVVTATARPGQNRFRFAVLGRCEGQCVACGLAVDVLLEAAHLCSVEDDGSDDPRNGIALCRNHHRAFDRPSFLFGVNPDSLEIVPSRGLSLSSLGIVQAAIAPGTAPHREALMWAWERFRAALER